jgi:hypothetical protein
VRDNRAVDKEVGQELEATIAARHELGSEHDEQLIAGFLDKIDKELDRRIDQKVKARRAPGRRVREGELGVFIPIFVIAGIFGGVVGIAAVAAALVALVVIQTFAR